HGLAPARRLAHDDQTRLFFQQRTQTGPQDGVIVRQENSDFSPTARATGIDHRRVSHSKSPSSLSKIRALAEELRRRHRTCLTVAAKSPLGSPRRWGPAREIGRATCREREEKS